MMKVAVLSGKGGTGKTFVSVNLAAVMANACYVDCDVEEPNGHLFLKPDWSDEVTVTRKLPVIDSEKCINCRACTNFCKFNALAGVGQKILVFEDICHSCGGCVLVCPEGAITEKEKPIGTIKTGQSKDTKIMTGTMHVKEASGVPIINQLLEQSKTYDNVVIDCPPGSACTVMESIKEAEFCVLVAEPTLFGQHNLAMVHELVTLYKKPYGVVLNKSIEGVNPSRDYCEKQKIAILGEVKYGEHLASLLSDGKIPVREDDHYRNLFNEIVDHIYKKMSSDKGEVI